MLFSFCVFLLIFFVIVEYFAFQSLISKFSITVQCLLFVHLQRLSKVFGNSLLPQLVPHLQELAISSNVRMSDCLL